MPEVLVSDFDGTLARISLPCPVHQWLARHRNGLIPLLIPLIPFLPLVFVGYLSRPPIRSAKEAILQHKERGGRVVVFSSTEDLRLTRCLIWSWLWLWRVPVDRLVLRSNGDSAEDFKMGVLLQESCPSLILLENEVPMVSELIRRMLGSGFRNISAARNGQRYTTVRFQR
jgi:hypothetical protein